MPSHKSSLRKGAIVILLRNLNEGLWNETQLKIIEMKDHVLVAKT